MTSHYVPYFSVERSANLKGQIARRVQAACGAFVDYPREHDVEPTCPACSAYLTQSCDEKTEEEMFG